MLLIQATSYLYAETGDLRVDSFAGDVMLRLFWIFLLIFCTCTAILVLMSKFLYRGDEPDRPFSGGIASFGNMRNASSMQKGSEFSIMFYMRSERKTNILDFSTNINLPPEVKTISTYETKGVNKNVALEGTVQWAGNRIKETTRYYAITLNTTTDSRQWSRPIEILSKMHVSTNSTLWPSGCYIQKISWLDRKYEESLWEKCPP